MKNLRQMYYVYGFSVLFAGVNLGAESAVQKPPPAAGVEIGVAEVDITPPAGFPMAGYYFERLAEGTIDPLKAKAIVFREGKTVAAIVLCDLIGIATDLTGAVREKASQKTGIPIQNIALSATHSHTAPDYMKELWLRLGKEKQLPLRAKYIDKLIDGPADAIAQALANAKPVKVTAGVAIQSTPVSFNRRFVMRDGSVKTWMGFQNPDVVRSAGPIDPEVGIVQIGDNTGAPMAILSNFALHLDTVGGMRWSADYPFFIEKTLRKHHGAGVISLFGTGCCGDINHSNPNGGDRLRAEFIGTSLGETIHKGLPDLKPVVPAPLAVKSKVVQLPLQDATKEEVARSLQVLAAIHRKERVDFLDHVTAYKKIILDQMLHKEPHTKAADHITWGLSRKLAGVGPTLPAEITVVTLGADVAVVCLPGEVFVNLGLAIKQGSPFRTTLVIELSNCVESIYVPHRGAYAGGSYEVTNSNVQPGAGEMLVEGALKLLREAASEIRRTTP